MVIVRTQTNLIRPINFAFCYTTSANSIIVFLCSDTYVINVENKSAKYLGDLWMVCQNHAK